MGWTNNPRKMAVKTMWTHPSDPGISTTRVYNLEQPKPVMCTTGEYGFYMVIFESYGKFYLWEEFNFDIELIEYPTIFDIIRVIKMDGLKGHEFKMLGQPYSDEEI